MKKETKNVGVEIERFSFPAGYWVVPKRVGQRKNMKETLLCIVARLHADLQHEIKQNGTPDALVEWEQTRAQVGVALDRFLSNTERRRLDAWIRRRQELRKASSQVALAEMKPCSTLVH